MPTLNIDLNWPDHPKTKLLIRAAGVDAPFRLITLWCYAAKYHPDDGDLSSYTADEIEGLVGWAGESGVFFTAMISSRYLDSDLKLHDWPEHEGHLAIYREKARLMNDAKRRKQQPRHPDDTIKRTPKTPTTSPSSVQFSTVHKKEEEMSVETPDPLLLEPEETPKPSNHQMAIQFWTDLYQDQLGEVYTFQDSKDGSAVKKLLKAKGIGLDGFKRAAKILLTTTDPFWMKNRCLTFLSGHINQILTADIKPKKVRESTRVTLD